MDNWRRYRGLFRTSLTTGVAFSGIALATAAFVVATGLVPSSLLGARDLISVALRGFGAGAAAGGLFGLLVARGERGKNLSNLSTGRIAVYGGLATGTVPLLVAVVAAGSLPISVLATGVLVYAAGGAGASAAMLRVARRERPELPAPDASHDRLLP